MPRNWYEWSKSADLKRRNEKPVVLDETDKRFEDDFNKTDVYLVIHRLRRDSFSARHQRNVKCEKDIKHANISSPNVNPKFFSPSTYNVRNNREGSQESLSTCFDSEDSLRESYSRGRIDSANSLQLYENGLNCWYDNLKASPELLTSYDCASRSSSISSSVFSSFPSPSTHEEESYLSGDVEKISVITNEVEIKIAILDWLKLISNSHGDPFIGLNAEENSPINPRIAVRTDPYHGFESKKDIPFEWDGPVDKEENFNGRGIVSFEDGGETCGTWKHGVRNGRGTTSCPNKNIKLLVCEFKNGKMCGQGRIVYNDEKTLDCNFRDGCLHGLARLLSPKKKLLWLGRYCNGIPHGVCWKFNPGGGYITGEVDSEGELSGDNICYIYPDLKTCYSGIFKDALMVQAKLSSVESVRLSKVDF